MATASLMATTPTIKTITGTMINMTTVISSNMGAKDTTMNRKHLPIRTSDYAD